MSKIKIFFSLISCCEVEKLDFYLHFLKLKWEGLWLHKQHCGVTCSILFLNTLNRLTEEILGFFKSIFNTIKHSNKESVSL